MKTLKLIAACIMAASLSVSATAKDVNIVPCPESVTIGKGQCNLAGADFTCDKTLGRKAETAVSRFSARLKEASGKLEGGAHVSFVFDAALEPEHYTITASGQNVRITACDRNGVLYAIYSLKQMLPEIIYGTETDMAADWSIPCCRIVDGPRFRYRGMHMDPSRHFWSVEETKRYLDVMAIYKLNRLHWHLTDDQGWRVEIKALPKLQEISAWRNGTMIDRRWDLDDGKTYGGYYTQEQIKEIIAYADDLGITVIPEIDLPGHMVAAITAYPELTCFGDHFEVRKHWGVASTVLCPGKESTFRFLETVLGEVADLFPGEYFHIGGDECPKYRWELCDNCQARIRELGLQDDDKFTAEQKLQNYVTERVQRFLATKGKKIIGWDEVLEGDNLAPGATVMSWRGTEGGILAAAKGFDVIMTPSSHCYIDYCQSLNPEKEPVSIGGFIDLAKVYSYDPLQGMTPGTEHHVLGAQCNLWTEYIATPEHLEYMLLPRMLALSEVVWSIPGHKNYGRFLKEVRDHQYRILDILKYNYKKY